MIIKKALRLGQRMCLPGSSQLFPSLVVADVDLDAAVAIALPALTPFPVPPEGVHALIWVHGVPVGEMTVAGDPGQLLPELPVLAQESAAAAVHEHMLQHGPEGSAVPPETRSPCVAEDLWRARVDGSLLTVAICTRDRPADLERCLAAVDGLTIGVAEVLVVDNAPSDDRTEEVAQHHSRARYVQEPRRGVGWARNRALLEARTPLIAFIDDDVLVEPRWAETLLMAFNAHPDTSVITGMVAPAELSTRAQVVFEATGGFGRGYQHRRLQAASTSPKDTAAAVYHIGAMGTGANMAFRRDRLIAVGGFDPALGPGTPTSGGEDQEALCRLLTCGDLIVYEPAAVVRHRHRRTMAELRGQRRSDGAGSASLLVGAGRNLGRAHHRRRIAVAARWWAKSTAWTVASSLLRPSARPMSLVTANARGWTSALARRSYRQAVDQARREACAYPELPVLTTAP
ncbi:glycosyltransferase [Modestobacter muralis]|uniref:Glycosyltransferase n=1 Tax=Modestobacter muralis TaxID=1608614 RepID=A0A6P0ETM2_9ACTN|nr:glycosyltransferase [Modestobacter muralis]NEK94477.1 glycosyltransferase [Modestobacter muralis]NEN51365.1 glycosyltransferase [Modestobacter muralis]